jgi:hypothetical protein
MLTRDGPNVSLYRLVALTENKGRSNAVSNFKLNLPSYARDRVSESGGPKPFDFQCQNCSHFAGDVLARAGFRGMGNGRASGLWSDFTNFGRATTSSYSAPFWLRLPPPPALSK